MIADPRAVAARWPEPRLRVLAAIAVVVAEAPWALDAPRRTAAHDAGLSDDDILHAVALAAYFGHLNRIADVVEVPLDYPVALAVPHAEAAVPPLAAAPALLAGAPAIELTLRPATATALETWRAYALERDAPLSRARRAVIASTVALLLGDAGDARSPARPDVADELDQALIELATDLTLAPWRLPGRSYDRLRAAGLDDAALFDACATASASTVFSRIAVALRALAIAR